MNFEKFKVRYIAKLMKSGLYSEKDREYLENDPEFNDRMAEIYLGLMVYVEFQNEHAREQIKQQKREAARQKIYVPHNGGLQ